MKHTWRIGSVFLLLAVLNGFARAGGEKKTQPLEDPLAANATAFLDEDPASLLVAGNREYRAGHYSQAARCYLHLLRRDSDNPTLMFLLAESYARWGHPRQAANLIRHAVNAGFDAANRLRDSAALAAMNFDPGLRRLRAGLLQWVEEGGDREYVKTLRLEPLRIHLPPGHDPDKPCTLLIGLHGNGDNAANFARLYKHFKRRDLIFAVPRGAYEKEISSILPQRRFSWDLETRDRELWAEADPLVVENIMAVRDHVARHHRIRETYLLGFSQGTAYAWATAIRHADTIRGVIAFAGILPPADKPWSLFSSDQLRAAASRLRVFLAHGDRDEAINVKNSETLARKLSGLGFSVEFHPFSGGHELPPGMLEKAIRWMMSPRSDPG